MKKIISIILSIVSIISIFSIPVKAEEIEYIDIYIPTYLNFIYDEGEREYYFPSQKELDDFLKIHPNWTGHDGTGYKWQSEINTDYPHARNYFKCTKCGKEYDINFEADGTTNLYEVYSNIQKVDSCGKYTIPYNWYDYISNMTENTKYYNMYYKQILPKRIYYYDNSNYTNYIKEDPNYYHENHTFLSYYDYTISHALGICQSEILNYFSHYNRCVGQNWFTASVVYTTINYDGNEFIDHQVQPINNFINSNITCQEDNYKLPITFETISEKYTGNPNYEITPYINTDDVDPIPTTEPTIIPTIEPTITPTETSTTIPTQVPTVVPTQIPTIKPTIKPNITTENNTEVKPTKVIETNVYVLKSDGTAEISGMVSTSTVKIPDTIVDTAGNVRKVTSIGVNAFKNNKKVKSIIIGKNVTVIKKNAFSGCKNLKSVNIRSTKLKSIEKNAFKNCKKLKKVTFKSKKIKFGKNSFKNIAKKAIFKVPTNKKTSYRKQLLKVTNKKIVVK